MAQPAYQGKRIEQEHPLVRVNLPEDAFGK